MKEEHRKDSISWERDYDQIRQVPLEEEDGFREVGSSSMGRGDGRQLVRKTDSRPLRSRKKGNSYNRERQSGRKIEAVPKQGYPFAAVFLSLVVGVMSGLSGGYYMWGWERPNTVDLKAVEVPKWVKQDFIRKNIFSRPDVGRRRVDNIVIHYVANPGSSAEGNRNYFDGLADQDPQQGGTSTSSHFIVGLEGEVIQCIPVDELAYANAPRNDDTISIEVCHPDETGKFNDAAYESVVQLTAWLCGQLDLTANDVVRHYDINGKICPKYFVENETAWEEFRSDVDQAIKKL